MATAWSGWRVWLSLLVLTWAAALRASPLSPATAGDKTSANGAKNDHTLPLLQLRSATHTAGDSETGPKITTSKHPDTKQTEIGRTYASTIAAVTNGDSPKLEPNVSAPQHCTDDFQCYSQNSNFSIPPSLVYCKNRTCVCNNCFVLINNTCAQKKCHHFNNASGKCVDERKSQKILLILSVFLSSTGSANLYIGQKVLGYSQFGLLLLAVFLCCCIYCTKKCFLDCCRCFEDECYCCECCTDFWLCCHEYCATVCVILSAFLLLLCLVAIAGWWAADISGFLENNKLDGDDCPLKNDL